MLHVIIFILRVLYDICVDVFSSHGMQKLLSSHTICTTFRDYTDVALTIPFGTHRRAKITRVKWSKISLGMHFDGGCIHISLLFQGLVVALACYDGLNNRFASKASDNNTNTKTSIKKELSDSQQSSNSSIKTQPLPSVAKKRSWPEFLASCGLRFSVAFEKTNFQVTVVDSSNKYASGIADERGKSHIGLVNDKGESGPVLVAHITSLSMDADLHTKSAKLSIEGVEVCLLPGASSSRVVRLLFVASAEALAKTTSPKTEVRVSVGPVELSVDSDNNSHTHDDFMRILSALVDTLTRRPSDRALAFGFWQAEERLFSDLDVAADEASGRESYGTAVPSSSSSSSSKNAALGAVSAEVNKTKYSMNMTLQALTVFVCDFSRHSCSPADHVADRISSSLLGIEGVEIGVEAGADEVSCVASSSVTCIVASLKGSCNKSLGSGRCLDIAATTSTRFSSEDGAIIGKERVVNVTSGNIPLLLVVDATLLCGLLNVVSDISSAVRAASSAVAIAQRHHPQAAAAKKGPGPATSLSSSRTAVDVPSLAIALCCKHPLSTSALAVTHIDCAQLGISNGDGATRVTVDRLAVAAFTVPMVGADFSLASIVQRAAGAPIAAIGGVSIRVSSGSELPFSAFTSRFASHGAHPHLWQAWLAEKADRATTSVDAKSCTVCIGSESDIVNLHVVLATVGNKRRPQEAIKKLNSSGNPITVHRHGQSQALAELKVSIDSISLRTFWIPYGNQAASAPETFSVDEVDSQQSGDDAIELSLPRGVMFSSTSARGVCSHALLRLRDEQATLMYIDRKGDRDCETALLTLRRGDEEVYSSTKFPLQLYSSSSGAVLMEERIILRVNIPSLFLILNATDYSCIHRMSAKCSKCSTAIACAAVGAIASTVRPADVSSKEMLHFTSKPTKILDVNVAKLEVLFEYRGEKAATLEVSSVVFNTLDYGSHLSQMCGSMRSLQLVDCTVASAVHRAIITNCSSSTQSIIRWHMTKQTNEFPLLEIDVEYLRLFYLQRATMMLVSYFRDHLVQSFKSPKPFTDPLWTRPPAAPSADAPPRMGMMRFCIRIKVLECHVPATCSASDALVIIAKEGRVFKNCPLLDDAYNRGPLLSQGRVLSEESNIAAYLNGASKETWLLPNLFRGLRASRFAVENTPPTSLDVSLGQCTFCSWCNENALCEGMDVHVTVTQAPIVPSYSGMYAEVFEAQGLAVDRPRNRLDVVVKTPTIYWKLAQGQYMTIVRLIQQNFQEQPSVVPDIFVLPTPQIVHLMEGLYGKSTMQSRVPFNSFVSWTIDDGSIVALQNRPTYYDYITRLPSPDPSAADSVPAWSCHRLHLQSILDDVTGNKARPTGGVRTSANMSTANIDLDDNYFDSNVYKNSSLYGEPVMILFLRDFYFDFVRKHYGYGNGINAYARTFLIAKPSSQFAKEFDAEAEGFSVNDVAAEDIIFAPKSISTARKATYSFDGRDEGYGEDEEKEKRPVTTDDYKALSHISYNQEGMKNLRRIIISMSDSMAVLHMSTLSATGAFFTEPISLNFHRNLKKLEANGRVPLDFKAAMDLEVRAKNVAICLPNSKIHGSCSALCINCDIDYEQSVRGFVNVGPGKITRAVSLAIYSVSIAPIHEVEYGMVESLLDPCTIRLTMMTYVVPEDSKMASHMEKLAPWVDFSGFSAKANKSGSAVQTKLISAEIVPIDIEADVETASVDISEDRPESSSYSHATYDDSSTPAVEGIVVQFSLQDVQFVVSCIQQLQQRGKGVEPRGPVTDIFAALLADINDIRHLPDLTFYLVHVPCQRPFVSVDNDVVIDICNLSIVLKNNTYNLKILKLDLYSNRISYNKTDDRLHSAVGITYSLWAFCESQEMWEPFLETSSVTAIAATDATSDATSTNSSVVRIEAHCNPIEINISQSILASVSRKLALSDVVTTNSQELPPYRIINDLGVDIQSCIYMGHEEILVEEIAAGNQVPIDFKAVASTVNFLKSKRKRKDEGRNMANFSDREHLMSVRIVSNNHVYEAKKPLPLGKEGVVPFDMRVARRKIEFFTSRKSTAQAFMGASAPTAAPQKSLVHRPQEIPLVFMSMQRKADGAKELTIRSKVSLKNHTSRFMQLSLWLGNDHIDTSLSPGAEWHMPLQFASPQTQLFLRPDERCEWIEALNSLSSLVVQGTWAAPQRLRADLCACPPEYPVPGAAETSWVILIKPDMRQKRTSGWAYTSVRYPSTDTYMSAQAAITGEDHNTLDDLYHIRHGAKKEHIAQPICINILPPLQLCSIVSQPLLYRMADKDGLISSEGAILPGEVVDIHSLSGLFTTQIFVSVRMVNYCWSKWVKLLSRRNPYSPTEKLSDVTMASMELSNAGEDILMPSLTLSVSLRDNVVRISCPLIVSNQTGLPLDFCESSNPEAFCPESGSCGVASMIGDKIAALQKGTKKGTTSSSELNESVLAASPLLDADTIAGEDLDDDDNSDDDLMDGATTAALQQRPNSSSIKKLSLGGRPLHHGLVPLLVHFPSDHLRKIEVIVSSAWTLSDVFKRIASSISSSTAGARSVDQSDYVFFYWEDGKRGSRKAIFSPSDEMDMFSRGKTKGAAEDTAAATAARDSASRGPSESPSSGVASAMLASTKSLFKSSPATPKSTDIAATQSADSLVPFNMQFAMLTDFPPPLPFDTLVEGLTSSRLRLCHIAEYTVYKQAQSIRTTSTKKDSSVTNYIFKKFKFVHRAQFTRVEGDLPFNPKKMLGFSPSISLRVSSRESEWSDALDLLRADFNDYFNLSREKKDREDGSSSSSISSISSISNSVGSHLSSGRQKEKERERDKGGPARDYQLSFLVEKGSALYQHVTTLTIVPRYLLVSNIAYAVQLRQAGMLDAKHIVILRPRNVLNFHYGSDASSKLLQIRWTDDTGAGSNEWTAEIDVSKLGIVYAKLRNPMYVLKIQVEMVGATLVATLSEQNLMFPPYRIQNLSSVAIRFRQVGEINERFAQDRPLAKDNSAAEQTTPWDNLPAAAMTPYMWDMPVTRSHTLRVETLTGDFWRGTDLKIDEEAAAADSCITVQRPLPPLGNPQAEGFLMRRSPSDGSWHQAYCILKGHCIYLFSDSNRKELLSIVNLCKQQFGGLQVAKVAKPANRRRESVQVMLEDAFKGSDNKGAQDKKIESNKLRILVLLIADKCGVFDDKDTVADRASKATPLAKSYVSTSLKRRLEAGDSLDQLLDQVQERPLPVFQVLAALQMLGEADDEPSARQVCYSLMSRGVLTVGEPSTQETSEEVERVSKRRSVTVSSLFAYSGRATVTFLSTPLFADLVTGSDPKGQISDAPPANIFTVSLGGQKGYLKCSSDSELLGWMLGCRQCIETAWIKFVIGEPLDVVTIDKYFFNVAVRYSSDGPTKVIELYDEKAGGSKSTGTDSIFDQLNLSAVDGDGSCEDPKHGLKFILDEEEDEEREVPILQHINSSFLISIKADAVSISLVDQEPCELFYLTLKDIDVTVEKVHTRLRVGFTVQDIQISNQLPSPNFPVMLCLREVPVAAAGASRLLLPGLHQQGSAFPALHIFVQQRQHKNFYRTIDTVREKKMLYFDIVSVWIAPLLLELEEELLVRILRLSNEVRSDIVKPLVGSYSSVGNEIIAAQQASARSWGLLDRQEAHSGLQRLLAAGSTPYADFAPLEGSSRDMYFRLMQLHPIDVVVTMRPSPDFSLTATEMALVSVVGQLDSSRLKLNALLTEHAHGSAALVREIIFKHYKAALWTQFQRLLGNSDLVDGSFGVVANLGTGVYDLFYEPIDGLMDENSSFLSGLSRGGKSLASHTIGGTSAITSKVIGGIGKGVSMLTMDSAFYRHRGARRMNKSNTMSEGLYVGTKELGKNIADGISGIVMKPYKGYQEGGSVGLVTGIGKGLLGVALKPAVGVFDLAARATEGMRNSAIGSSVRGGATGKGARSRARIPRAFGAAGLLIAYAEDAAAAQFVADQLLSDKSSAGGKRFVVSHFQYCNRYITDSQRAESTGKFTGNASSHQPFSKFDVGFADFKVLHEAWGMPVGTSYVTLVDVDVVALCQVGSDKRGDNYDVRLVWKCPAECIDQIFSDARGDLVLNVHTTVVAGTVAATDNSAPVIVDSTGQDYFIMQGLLEKTLGARLARMQPLVPVPHVGLVQRDVLKRYATGIKSLLKSPTKHSFHLFGYVLYEYTLPDKKVERGNTLAGGADAGSAARSETTQAVKSSKRSKTDRTLEWKVGEIFEKYVDNNFFSNNNSATNLRSSQEAVNRLSGPGNKVASLAQEGVLSYLYPLVDSIVCGPFPEDDGSFSINITRKDSLSMKVLKRDEDSHMLTEHHKSTLVLIFDDNVTAVKWRQAIESHTAVLPNDTILSGDEGGGMITNKLRNMAGMITGGPSSSAAEPTDNSIGSMLVIPTSGCRPQYSERLKIDIAKSMQSKYLSQMQ